MGWFDRRKQRKDESFLAAGTLLDSTSSAGQETIESIRARVNAQPGDARAVRRLAKMLRDSAADTPPAEAIAPLEESESLYASLGGPAAEIADVRCRKGAAQAAAGRGASAVLTLDEALMGYDSAGANLPGSPYFLDCAQAFLVNAQVLRRYGDPDLAVASADCALRQYLTMRDEINRAPDGPVHLGRFHEALVIASELHAAGGRLHLALQVDDLAIRGAPAAGDTAAKARARMAVHLRADGRTREAEELSQQVRASSPEALMEAEGTFARPERPTLRQAVDAARSALGAGIVPRSLETVLTDPGDASEAAWCASTRCADEAMAAAASHLAQAAHRLATTSPGHRESGRTLAMEAHYMFAVASAAQAPDLRYGFSSHGLHWARTLLWLAQSVYGEEDPAMTGDLADWLRGVLMQLLPHSLIDPEAQTVFEEGNRFVTSLPG